MKWKEQNVAKCKQAIADKCKSKTITSFSSSGGRQKVDQPRTHTGIFGLDLQKP